MLARQTESGALTDSWQADAASSITASTFAPTTWTCALFDAPGHPTKIRSNRNPGCRRRIHKGTHRTRGCRGAYIHPNPLQRLPKRHRTERKSGTFRLQDPVHRSIPLQPAFRILATDLNIRPPPSPPPLRFLQTHRIRRWESKLHLQDKDHSFPRIHLSHSSSRRSWVCSSVTQVPSFFAIRTRSTGATGASAPVWSASLSRTLGRAVRYADTILAGLAGKAASAASTAPCRLHSLFPVQSGWQGRMHCPPAEQVAPLSQVPQMLPQPSGPQSLLTQSGVQPGPTHVPFSEHVWPTGQEPHDLQPLSPHCFPLAQSGMHPTVEHAKPDRMRFQPDRSTAAPTAIVSMTSRYIREQEASVKHWNRIWLAKRIEGHLPIR